ncbi:MAG TPA: DUF2798 domain-containing protein [Bacteroidia bacterium]|nr:DUF2798 domain-containing protein [Bacteroidia bacterium]
MKEKLAFAMLMGIVTTCIISFTLIAINVGFSARFLTIWLRSWGLAYMVAIPAILVIGPKIQLLVNHLFKSKNNSHDTK